MVVLILVPSETVKPLPVPELAIASTAPEAEAKDWVRDSTLAESLQVPAVTVQLELRAARAPVVVKAPPVLVVKARLRFSRLPELVTVVV